MSDVIGRGVIEVSADSRKLTAGIDEAKRSLKSLGIAAGDATKGQSQSIDRYVKSLGMAAVTSGKTARELELYKLALRGANAEQLKAADSALRMSEAYARGEQIGRQIKTGLLAIGVAATTGLIAAFVAFGQLTKKAGDFQDMAEKTGDTAQNIASLAVAAGTAGVGMETIVSASAKLTKGLTGVDDESKAAGSAIAALGLNIKDFKALAPADQMEAVAKALDGFKDGAQKTAVAMALFGKSGADLLPFLKELGAEGGRQVILTQAQIVQADAYADRQAKLRTELSLHAQAIASQMVPAYNLFTESLVDVAKEILGVQNGIAGMTKGDEIKRFAQDGAILLANIADIAYDVAGAFRFVGDNLGAMAAIAMANARLDFAGAIAIGAASDEQNARILKGLGLADKVQAKIDAMNRPKATGFVDPRLLGSVGTIAEQDAVLNPKKTLTFDGATSKTGKGSALKAETEAARELKKAYDELMKVAMARSVARNTEYTSINDYLMSEERARIETVKAANDSVRNAQDEYDNYGKTKSQIAEVTLARLNDKLQAVNAGSTIAASIEAEIDAQKRLIAIMQKVEKRDTTDKAIEEQKKAADSYASTLHDDVKNALSTAFRDTKDPIKAFGDALGNVIFTRVTSSIADAMATRIIDSSIAKGFMSMFGFKDGGAFDLSGVQAFASGGSFTNQVVNQATPFKFASGGSFKQGIMGEAGPEAVMPLTRGPDGKLGVQASGGQAVTVNQYFTVGDVASVSMVRQAVAGSEKRIAGAMGRSMSYGGALS